MSHSFDPRRHSMVALTVKEKVPAGFRTDEFPVRNFNVGPHEQGFSLRRPVTAPQATATFARAGNVAPPFLTVNGTWEQNAIPTPIAQTQSQALTARRPTRGTLPGGHGVAPVAAVHSYADISPVVTAQYTRDCDAESAEQTAVIHSTATFRPPSPQVKSPYLQPPSPGAAGPKTPSPKEATKASIFKETKPTLRFSNARPETAPVPAKLSPKVQQHSPYLRPTAPPYHTANPYAHAGFSSQGLSGKIGTNDNAGAVAAAGDETKKSSESFWSLNASQLAINDLTRIDDLGRNVVAGSHNCRLVGSRWRYIPRPTEGDVVYTDYYGRYGTEKSNYYGRVYQTQTLEYAKNRLVGDTDYQRVQASMPGIQQLKNRPGLALEATVAHGAPERLEATSAAYVKTAGLHRITDRYNMRDATEKDLEMSMPN